MCFPLMCNRNFCTVLYSVAHHIWWGFFGVLCAGNWGYLFCHYERDQPDNGIDPYEYIVILTKQQYIMCVAICYRIKQLDEKLIVVGINVEVIHT